MWGIGEKVTVWDGKVLGELEGLSAGRPWEARHERVAPTTLSIIAYWYY
jgi:hypothetical protein